ncbi:HEAT repeat domain-containing protein [Streptomyces sp. NPDC048604]|uniref:HEAT repeat domain-containing protein n=1 Tax=Streptomyces sp. NPDC048604 TaxID=3365578 RepID=UPI00372053BB
MGGAELIAAVRDGDAEAIRRLTDAGADPDTAAEDGLPLLCAAIAAYDAEAAEALVEGGANPDRPLPDGTTPLLRAIEAGSPAVFGSALGRDPGVRLRGPQGERALATARNWYERSRSAPGERIRISDGEYRDVDELTLDGRTVRAGHGAILTELEWALRILTPVDELAARAVVHPDPSHTDWWAALYVLIQRPSQQTWSAVAALRHHPDPAHRRFAADVLRSLTLFRGSSMHTYEKETSELFAVWATEETDGRVLAEVLEAWAGEYDHPDMVTVGLAYTEHPHPSVRGAVTSCLYTKPLDPRARAALLALAGDVDVEVRAGACRTLGENHDGSPEVREALLALARDADAGVRAVTADVLSECDDRDPAVADALFALLDEENQLVRVIAAYGLSRHDDPRTPGAIERVGPLEAGLEHDHRWSRLWQWNWNRRNSSAATEE